MKIGIIGAGPCGIFTAISIKNNHPNYDVFLMDKSPEIGPRIKVSGNGRCNFFNKNISIDKYSKFDGLVNILSLKKELFDLIDESGLAYYSDEEGRYYPLSETSLSVIHCFKELLIKRKVYILTNYDVKDIKHLNEKIIINNDKNMVFDKLVVTIGGISSNNERLNYNNILTCIGANINKLSPSLCPISTSSFNPKLEGKRQKCNVFLQYKNKVVKEEQGEVLFKKNGLSGIVIFNMSSYLSRMHTNDYRDYQISLDLLPDLEKSEISKLIEKDKTLENIFNKELAYEILSRKGDILSNIKELKFNIKELYEFKFSQVTSGGVSSEALGKDLSLKNNHKIYIGGETLDVDGECGGFNIGFAMLCGLYIGRNME